MEVIKGLVLMQEHSSKEGLIRLDAFTHELNRVIRIASPMIIMTVCQFLMRASPMFMLGHLDELSLSSASVALSLCNATGFSVMIGMSSALETLCGQAFGAEEYKRVGTLTYGAIISLLIVCIPVSIIWVFTEKLLIFIGQDPLISAEAGKFAIMLIPTLFPFAILQCVVRYLQTQSLILPMLWSSLVSVFIQLGLCWVFLFKLGMGNAGAAISTGISHVFNLIFLLVYVKYSSACSKTRTICSADAFLTMKEFFQLAIPSASMICLEWWLSEIIILLAGILAHPQLETSVIAICLMITTFHFFIPYSFSAAASTLISNELGAGKPDAARVALHAVLVLSVTEFLIASIAVFSCRNVLGYAFSKEKVVVDYVKKMSPLLALTILTDSLKATLSGVARGTGWQRIGAYVNLGAYYLVGLPVTLLLAFVLHLGGLGLWTGLVAAGTLQCIAYSIVTIRTDWGKQAIEAREIFSRKACDSEQSMRLNRTEGNATALHVL